MAHDSKARANKMSEEQKQNKIITLANVLKNKSTTNSKTTSSNQYILALQKNIKELEKIKRACADEKQKAKLILDIAKLNIQLFKLAGKQ